MILLAFFLLGIGWAIKHWIARRRFYRMSAGGVQQYRSYFASVVSSFVEGMAGLIGLVCTMGGMGILCYHGYLYWLANHANR